MTEEDAIKRRCKAAIRKEKFPDFYHYCPTDHFVSGIPDFIFCARGAFGWVELKTPKGVVSPIQLWTHDQMEKAGGRGKVCRSVQEFIEFIWSFYKPEERP